MSNPSLKREERERLVKELMQARRMVRLALQHDDKAAEAEARRLVDEAKVALGERGPVWWSDGAPNLNRHLARNPPYAGWFAKLDG